MPLPIIAGVAGAAKAVAPLIAGTAARAAAGTAARTVAGQAAKTGAQRATLGVGRTASGKILQATKPRKQWDWSNMAGNFSEELGDRS